MHFLTHAKNYLIDDALRDAVICWCSAVVTCFIPDHIFWWICQNSWWCWWYDYDDDDDDNDVYLSEWFRLARLPGALPFTCKEEDMEKKVKILRETKQNVQLKADFYFTYNLNPSVVGTMSFDMAKSVVKQIVDKNSSQGLFATSKTLSSSSAVSSASSFYKTSSQGLLATSKTSSSSSSELEFE